MTQDPSASTLSFTPSAPVVHPHFEDQGETDDDEEDGLGAMHGDADQRAAIPARQPGLGEGVDQDGLRYHPRLVEVVTGEQHAVDHPVSAAEPCHPGKHQASEEEFLAQDSGLLAAPVGLLHGLVTVADSTPISTCRMTCGLDRSGENPCTLTCEVASPTLCGSTCGTWTLTTRRHTCSSSTSVATD